MVARRIIGSGRQARNPGSKPARQEHVHKKNIPADQNEINKIQPSSPGRRSFVKGIATMGAGIAAFPLISNAAEAQAPAAPDNSPGPRGAKVPKAAGFQGDKIDWHGFDRYDFVMDMQTLAITPFKAPAGEAVRQSRKLG